MARFSIKNTCVKCFSENLDIPSKKNADTIITCLDCSHQERWVKIVTLALVRTRKKASYYFQKRQQELYKQEDTIIKDKNK